MIIPPGWDDEWKHGEYQAWARVHAKPGATITWVLYPKVENQNSVQLEAIPGGIRLKGGNREVDEVLLSTENGVTVKVGGKTERLIQQGELPALGTVERGLPVIIRKENTIKK